LGAYKNYYTHIQYLVRNVQSLIKKFDEVDLGLIKELKKTMWSLIKELKKTWWSLIKKRLD
jgi:hypothetical protein